MFVYPRDYDVIVVGGGHAGVEAALASARIGCTTLLLTINLDTIGQMSCNPAIGGLAKGHLAREIDALGGEMGRNADMSGLQFRMLNTKKGPSVWAPRAQCDKKAYQYRLKWVCERQDRLDCRQGQTVDLLVRDGIAYGVETNLGVRFHGKTVILTTGTFLRGLMHIGSQRESGGRSGEAAVTGLSAALKRIGFELGRMKTGTPPRLNRRTIDFNGLQEQPGDEPVPYFSYWLDEMFHVEQSSSDSSPYRTSSQYPPRSVLARAGGQLPCYLTETTVQTKRTILDNLHRSPLYSGTIEGVGPRYCPSIEDKIVRFSDKQTHQLFLEPEGIATEEIYVNGFSTSLPFSVQIDLVHTILGCEHAEILRPAYAVEYDFAPPTQLHPSLESKLCSHLFLAGQINGTSGYEEAAAQGLLAGINAAQLALSKEPLILRRDQAYIGVLIDDLVTKGTTEPYRMFTSRAEFRLLLRQDNADQRLCDIGRTVGLLPLARYEKFRAKWTAILHEAKRLEATYENGTSLARILRRPEVDYQTMPQRRTDIDSKVARQVEIMVKYAGYIERQSAEVNKLRAMESKRIPDSVNYAAITGLRTESRLKLDQVRPRTLGQASRISGVSPADVGLLLVHLKRGSTAGNES